MLIIIQDYKVYHPFLLSH